MRIARLRLAACLAGMVIGGIALARDTPPAAAPAAMLGQAPETSAAAPAPAAPQLSEARLAQLVAPIALYPDPLLAQILMASTYPLEVVEAARWVEVPANRALTGDALAGALAAQNWDPSVKALVAFPDVLENMSNRLQWTEALGNAFLAQQADVMGAVQRLRHQAMAAGTLRTTQQCDCRVEADGETVAIPPAEPEAVRVPVYGAQVYGPWPDTEYQPDPFPPPEGFDYLPGFPIGFDAPVDLALFAPVWGWSWIDWGQRKIVAGARRHALASPGRAAFEGRVWVHDPAHRGGVRYADAATRTRFDAARVATLVTAAARPETAPQLGAARRQALPASAGRFAAAAPTRSEVAVAAPAPERAVARNGETASRGRVGFYRAFAARGWAAFHAGLNRIRSGLGLHGLRTNEPGGRPR